MSWIKPPSFLQLPAQRLGNLLPNLPATKAKKTLQNTDDQKQSAVMLPFLAYAPWQHLSAKDSSKEASCKSCPASFPPNSDGNPPPPRSGWRLKGLLNSGKVHASPSAWESPPSSGLPCRSIAADLVRHRFGGKPYRFSGLRRRLSERSLFPSQVLSAFIP